MQEIFNLMRILNPFSKPAFIDTIESLENEFNHSNDNNVIILNVSEVSKHYTVSFFRKKYGGKIIAFNQEPLLAKQQQFMHFKFFNFLKDADEVWDYDERQVAIIRTINKNTHLHILQPYKDWSIYETMPKDIDILFYGSLNEHRQKLLNVLGKKYNLVICNGKHGEELDSFIARSKTLLNIHYYYECAMQEQARMVRWLGAPCNIISETSWKNYLNVPELNYNDLFFL